MLKKLSILLFLNILIFNSQVYGADLNTLIPAKTLQIAKDAGLEILDDTSKIVRVGIGTNNFSSYFWENASIYTTGEFDLYQGEKYINTFSSSNIVNIKRNNKTFIITDNNNCEIYKTDKPLTFKPNVGFIGIKGLKRAGLDANYRGDIEIVPATKENQFQIVNVIPVEAYLKGVVPNEMPVRFGLEALKAQSVAARNYVLSPRVKLNPNYDVVDSVASQVYFGCNTEKELSNQAVQETSGLVALYNWDLILAQYSSTAGGYSESFKNTFSDPKTKKFPSDSKPYLVAKPDYDNVKPLNNEKDAAEFYKSKPKSFDELSPYFRWEREWNGQEIQDAIQSTIAAQSTTGFIAPTVEKGETIGIVKNLNVLKRGDSGKIIELEIETDDKNYKVQKELVIRRLLTNHGKALPSANVIFEPEYNEKGELIYIKAYGGGFGHGVGMSQYGAGYMGSELKMSFDQILKHYYSDISIATEPVILSSIPEQNSIIQNIFIKKQKAYLVVDNKYKLDYVDANINNTSLKIEFDTSQRYNQIDLSKHLKSGMNTIKLYYPIESGTNKGIRTYIELVGENDRHCHRN